MRSRIAVSAFALGLGLMAAVLVSCGGSSSSTSGPSAGGGGGGASGAIVRGQIQSGRSAQGEPVVIVALEKILGIGVAEAQAGAPVPDGTIVTLTPTGGGAPLQTTTTGGAFEFSNVLPGEYTISVAGFTTVIGTTMVSVGAGDLANITGTANVDQLVVTSVHVVAINTSPDAILQNDAQIGHLVNLALAAGVPADTVYQMRLSGMGWGQIAHALGVHPSNIGLGHEHQAEAEAFKASKGKGKGKNKA